MLKFKKNCQKAISQFDLIKKYAEYDTSLCLFSNFFRPCGTTKNVEADLQTKWFPFKELEHTVALLYLGCKWYQIANSDLKQANHSAERTNQHLAVYPET